MQECPKLKTCIFFNDKMKNMPAMSKSYKNQYCLKNYQDCARFKVSTALGADKVPATLYPNDADEAKKLIGQ